MKSIKNPIVMMTIFLTIVLPEGRGELKNEVTFKRVGELAVGATYGHLTFDIDLDRVRIAYDALQDTLKHVINAQQNVPALQGQKEEVKMVWEKLEILYALVQHDQIKAEVDEDEQDRVGNALNQLRNKRQLLAAVAGIMGLTSFGTSMYSIGQLKTLKDNIGEQGERIEFLSHQIQEQDLRIYNITQATRRYVEESVDAIGKVAEETRRLTIVKALETSARTYLLNFRMALTDLTIGITELMEGRLSPLLIDPHKLDEAYRNLLAAAKKVGLEPVSLHPGIVFQTPVSVLGKDDRQLVVMVHVPLNAGTLILYKYLPSPIIFEDKDVALYVEDEEKYLAMDAHQTIGLQLTPWEFDRCLKMKGVYSCKKSHVFTKSLERLCLYNLFVQRTEEVSKTCQVKVGPLKSSVSQIKTNAYRLGSCHRDQRMFERERDGPNRPQDRRRGTHEGVSKNLHRGLSPHLSGQYKREGGPCVTSFRRGYVDPDGGDEQHRRQLPQGGSRGLHLHVRKGDDRTTSGIQGQVGSRALEEGGTQTSIRTRRYHHHRRRSNCVLVPKTYVQILFTPVREDPRVTGAPGKLSW